MYLCVTNDLAARSVGISRYARYIIPTDLQDKSEDIQRMYIFHTNENLLNSVARSYYYHFANAIPTNDCQRYSKSINYL